MNLTSPNDVRSYLDELGVQPNRRLGQNFLIDRNILDRIIAAADLAPGDIVLEVGPGLGVMTEPLLHSCRQLIVVEKDNRLAQALAGRFDAQLSRRLTVIGADMLSCSLAELRRQHLSPPDVPIKVVSNLPYSVGSRILMDFAQDAQPPELVVVTVQLEVAERLSAKPGSRTFGLLGVWMQDLYEVDVVKVISPSCFWPRPAVKSAIVRMSRRRRAMPPPEETRAFHLLTRYAFAHRRKQLPKLLEGGPLSVDASVTRTWLERHGYATTARPEIIAVDDWRGMIRDLAVKPMP